MPSTFEIINHWKNLLFEVYFLIYNYQISRGVFPYKNYKDLFYNFGIVYLLFSLYRGLGIESLFTPTHTIWVCFMSCNTITFLTIMNETPKTVRMYLNRSFQFGISPVPSHAQHIFWYSSLSMSFSWHTHGHSFVLVILYSFLPNIQPSQISHHH